MNFFVRAATLAVANLCAGALANAATPQTVPAAQDAPVQVQNPRPAPVVPAVQSATTVFAPAAEVVQPIPAEAEEDDDFASLTDAVAAQDAPEAMDDELNCLASSVYYEAKSEPLAGQLAVAQVILNRTQSGRFPRNVCSVVKQPGQFSFVRRGHIPSPPSNAQWRKAVAVAQVARKDLWDSPVASALYFHARYVKAGWNRPVVGTVGNHVFYR